MSKRKALTRLGGTSDARFFQFYARAFKFVGVKHLALRDSPILRAEYLIGEILGGIKGSAATPFRAPFIGGYAST
jgi:hypothetical protein